VIVAAVAMALVVAVAQSRRLGPQADWVEVVRAVCLPILDRVLDPALGGVGAAYEIAASERVGVLDATPEETERLLWQAGCRRNVLSASKTLPDGRRQRGAWVYRRAADVGASMQVDIMLFEARGGTAVYAHHEYSSALRPFRPSVLLKHYRGAIYDPATGGRILQQAILPSARWIE
jgi:hypothetical protein